MRENWKVLSSQLSDLLSLAHAPLAITFSKEAPRDVPMHEGAIPEPAGDGRTGRVPAGCVFWMDASDRTFSTVPEDHANCSVGSVTHGLKTLEEVSGNSDVAAMLECGWITEDVVPLIPSVQERPNYITYGPLADTAMDPDVVLLRVNSKQAMTLHGAVPGIRMEGKPQCHIIPLAIENGDASLSLGCMLSRVRTGLTNNEMTCAIPARRLSEVVGSLSRCCEADAAVSVYAAEDSKRFGRHARTES